MLKYEEFPSLYRSCDKYSLNAQKKYINLFRIELFLIIAGAIVGSLNIASPDFGKPVAILATLCFLGGLLVSIYIRYEKLEDKWYIGRALAESIKSITWRYVTKGEPFEDNRSSEEVDNSFRTSMSDFISENKDFISGSIQGGNMDVISGRMKEIRSSSFEERKALYMKERVQDQMNWYKLKANTNSNKKKYFFSATVIAYLVAIIYHLVVIGDNTIYNAAPVLATIVGALISWTTMKKYQELSQSYAVTAHEIALIFDAGKDIITQESFYGFIGDAEAAFSREHTLWLARRDILR